ncbi:MAG: hypothetical protein N3F67_04915 [Acidilobaceae archaeon]|nr:hypothetical protein [Acidilobaceae archaeon]
MGYMGLLEASVAVVHGKVVENFRMPSAEDAYYETLIIPGFSDGHAHPQVVDGGVREGRRWSDSYDWLERRELAVDEVKVRRDLELSKRLARLTLLRGLLEGTTLMALTGRLLANVKALLSLKHRPRAVLLPTVMDRAGWTLEEVREDYAKASYLVGDGMARMGIFVHSLRLAKESTVREAISLAAKSGAVLGLHLGEGVSERGRFLEVFGRPPYSIRIVPVHCIDDDMSSLGLSCVACPATNVMLYGRTRRDLSGISAFGSDWPLLLGTTPMHLPLMLRAFRDSPLSLLRSATVGGYRLYNVPHDGDYVAYDASLEEVLRERRPPSLVVVNEEVAVREGRLVEGGYALSDVRKAVEEAVKEALDLYGNGHSASSLLREHEELFMRWS